MIAYPKGSEWRRWDLHIHTPQTIKNDCFTGENPDEKWTRFYSDIKDYVGDGSDDSKNISVIGITDYLSINNYRKVIHDNKLPCSISLVLPNIEMRMQPPASDSPINIHFLFNPAIETSIEDRFFAKLSFTYGDTDFSATRTELIRLGRTLDGTLDDENAYKKGVEQFVPSFDKIKEVFTKDAVLRNNTIILVSNSSTDGVSGATNHSDYFDTENGDPQLKAFRQSVYKFVDGVFSATPSDVNFFLGKKENCPPELVISECGSLKPCVHGCDAHENPKMFEPDQKRYCWIKADPTFNGLKQIIYEPEERVCIAETKPETKSSYQVIESITIDDDDFQSEPIVFNDKLTCIIGGKSTGKSILLHNLARAISPKQVEEKCEISTGKGKSDKNVKPLTLEIDSAKLDVKWADGNATNGQAIVYIPQTYLNRLADSVQETTEIDDIIEKVLLDRTDINGAKLRDKKTALYDFINSTKSDNTNKILDILRIHAQIQELTEQIKELGGKEPVSKELIKLRNEREKLSKELNIQEDDIKKFDDANVNIDIQNRLIKQFNAEIEQITLINSVVQQSELTFSFCDETKSEIKIVVDDILLKANESWTVQKEIILSKLKEKLSESKSSLDTSLQIRDTLKNTIESSNRIKELVDKINKEADKLKEINEKEELKSEAQEKLDVLINQVTKSYIDLQSLYEEYAKHINDNTKEESSDLKYDVRTPFRQDDFFLKWSEIYGSKSKISRELIEPGNFKYTSEFLVMVINKTLSEELAPLQKWTIENALRNILDDWYNIKYVVRMGNDAIDVMSPGKKALVLLKLLIDLADSECPILIDQPEDDLDNRSIFEQLIPFIKRKKIERQIIIVTHNANIVVGADAEEIIIANQDGSDSAKKSKRFEYRSGSIENDYPIYKSDGSIEDGILNKQGVQQHICDILEGGITAFEKRKNKYHI